MSYEVCTKCYGTLNKGHECGPKALAKDDLCPKCLIVLDDCTKTNFHYARDMIQIEEIARDGEDDIPSHTKLAQIQEVLARREKRILKEMENGRIKRA